jgi:ribosomal protein S18 acetylase RimI-like enzyme
MKFIRAKIENITTIMNIIQDAQTHLASSQIDQWQDGYPDEKIIQQDIINQESYLVKGNSNETMGIAMFTTQAELTYKTIDGSWLTNKDATYGVIHRMAVSHLFRKQGVAKYIFKICEQKLRDNRIGSMRIDTHKDNKEMQGLLQQLGYVYCGIIYLDDFDTRLAFEKLIL